jgi:hypothetical protein
LSPLRTFFSNRANLRPQRIFIALALLLALNMFTTSSHALLTIDFDQKYLTHQDRQVWDFSVIRPDSVYHAFYHTIHEETPIATYGDTIWHATSLDLKHWDIEGPILTVGTDFWDEGAMWAPDVFWDDQAERYTIAYTGCDATMNQRICMAYSDDLYTWEKSGTNPTVEADPTEYIWNEEYGWANFRDPYVYMEGGQYHMLVTAKKWVTQATGAIYHGISDDLVNWTSLDPFFLNDGPNPSLVMESAQYHQRGNFHHLFFGEYGINGISHVSSRQADALTMDTRQIIDDGNAPEIDVFDDGINIFSRLAKYQINGSPDISYTVRFDTLTFDLDGSNPVVQMPSPLAENWATYSGMSCLANPTFGDNSAARGAEPVGLVGNSYFGSAEYFLGPLAGRGSSGAFLGDGATISSMESYPFIITGDRMTLLVGGGNYPETVYVALMDASADTVIYKETGNGQETMSLREWDLHPHQGQTAYIKICDSETATMGHINVDEIRELIDETSPVNGPGVIFQLDRHFASPNPFNPMTNIYFNLSREMNVNVRIHDIRGNVIWESGSRMAQAGENSLTWQGKTSHGMAAPAGTYLYSIETEGQLAASGKISLVK